MSALPLPERPYPRYPGYLSEEAYSFPPEQGDKIIRATSFHRRAPDLAVISFPPQEHDKVRTSISSAFGEKPTSSGLLDRLPVELFYPICLQLDVLSLFRLRQANNSVREVLETQKEYQIVATHALDAFRALLRTQSASRVTLEDFYRLLCTRECSVCCEKYGNLVFLPTWYRCCSPCLRHQYTAGEYSMHTPHGYPFKLSVTTVARAKQQLHLSEESLAKLPLLTTVPGNYTKDQRPTSRMVVVPVHDALLAWDPNPRYKAANRKVAELRVRMALSFASCCPLPSYDRQCRQVENGLTCGGCQVALESVTVDTRLWWTNIRGLRDEIYSRKGFLEHFVWCKQAQRLWLDNKEGTIMYEGPRR